MTAWYESTFSRDYLTLYRHRNQDEANRDVDALLSLVHLQPDLPLLDLCCGAGRHLVALAQKGFGKLAGLDLSADLLAEARKKLDEASIHHVKLVRSDMREIPWKEEFAAIISLFTSFGYFQTQQEDECVLASAHSALAPQGTLILDTLNREHVIASLIANETKTVGDKCIRIRRNLSRDGLRVKKETRVTQPGSPETIYRESVRMYQQSEIIEMLERHGFAATRFFGSLRGEPLTDSSPRMVFVTSKGTL